MTELPDRDTRLLSALIDGELATDETEALQRRLRDEPDLAARLAAMRLADAKLQAAYVPLVDAPLPASLLALLQDETAEPEATDPKVVPLRRPKTPSQFWIPSSIAAGIALGIGLAVGLSLNVGDGLSDTARLLAANELVSPDRELFPVLESVASGNTVALDGDFSATPRLSFRTAAGGYCRELGLSSNETQTALVGCREDRGWRLQAVIQVTGPGATNPNNEFQPASGPASALDAIVSGLIVDAPLGAAAEVEAIASGWK